MTGILIDTGPLVALLHPNDPHHADCEAIANTLRPPLYSCWPVITEAAYLLGRFPKSVSKLLGYCDGSLIELLPLDGSDIVPIDSILMGYADQKFDLADAALMHLANREGIETVFTLDQRHFSVYRNQERRPLHILPPTKFG